MPTSLWNREYKVDHRLSNDRWSAYVTVKCPKGWLKERFFCIFWVKVNGCLSQVLSTYFTGECHKHLMVGGNVDHIHRRDLYSAARPSRRKAFYMASYCAQNFLAWDIFKCISSSFNYRLPTICFHFHTTDIITVSLSMKYNSAS